MQSQAIFFCLNKVTHTYTSTNHLLGSQCLYVEFCNSSLPPVPTINASALLFQVTQYILDFRKVNLKQSQNWSVYSHK